LTDRQAIVLPGVRYTPARPLLHFTRAVLESHGWTVLEASWPTDDPAERDPGEMVTSVATRLIDASEDAQSLIVGKSIGSFAMPLAASRGIPGIWITPLLRQPTLAQALTRLPAATLLVGSTADETWDAEVARQSGHQVMELTDANHGLELGGDPLGSIDALRRVIEEIDDFVARLDDLLP
jgi:hypothetical protein